MKKGEKEKDVISTIDAALDEWITSAEATKILNEHAERHADRSTYIRKLAAHGKIRIHVINSNTQLYNRRDVEAYVISSKPGPKTGFKRK